MSELRVCRTCTVEQSLNEYYSYNHPNGQTYYHKDCKTCDRKAAKESHAKTYPNISDEQRKKNNKRGNASKLKKRYGLTPEQVERMAEEQSYQCYICGVSIDRRKVVDHNHQTGKVRKLLCFNCNVALGHFHDSTNIMQKAIDYIKEHDAEPGFENL